MPLRPLHLAWLFAAILLLAAPAVRATDVVAMGPPVHVDDAAVRIGSRTVRLPAGDWTLVHAKDVRPAQARDIDVTIA